ncbi:MAG: hypothetical protein, partial [Olavius algarvensis Gamma 1 endosymbiont]
VQAGKKVANLSRARIPGGVRGHARELFTELSTGSVGKWEYPNRV